ncbi:MULTISPECIES: TIGR02281 family clan AA aspartic protease [unclassified Anabaena]|uniref:retropepsin-like aspartic protease family protein n=1 Tax=unclassified Anabaena TaxID=2619674 RepID=UPI0039C5D017
MLQSFLSRATLIFLSSTLAVLGAACNEEKQTAGNISSQNSVVTDNLLVSPTIEPVTSPAIPAARTPVESEISSFEMGLDKAVGAWRISQSAQSSDDWNLVAGQLQEAIAFMEKVPQQSPEFATAQTKISEYRGQMQNARQKATPRPVSTPKIDNQSIVVAVPQPKNKPQPSLTPPAAIKQREVKPVLPTSALIAPEKKVFIAPIKRRIGGTPIVEVTFNNQQQFEMIVDTGASGTVITQKMANALGVSPVGIAKANTASARAVEFPIGYVDSMAVAGVMVNRVAVAIAGTELETGLLGHDFFGNYDVTIRRDVVEFHPQSHSEINSVETQPAVPVFPRENHSEEFP